MKTLNLNKFEFITDFLMYDWKRIILKLDYYSSLIVELSNARKHDFIPAEEILKIYLTEKDKMNDTRIKAYKEIINFLSEE